MTFFENQLKQLEGQVHGLRLANDAHGATNHSRLLSDLECAFRNLVAGYEVTERRLKIAAVQLEGDACKHPASLIMGREETGGRRFPIVWCPECGAIKFDSHMEILPGTPEAQWMLPEREKATAGRLI